MTFATPFAFFDDAFLSAPTMTAVYLPTYLLVVVLCYVDLICLRDNDRLRHLQTSRR